MELLRQLEFFDPHTIDATIHIIGVGAIGSHIAEMMVRMGVKDITLYDFDTVDTHNIPNQMYRDCDIGVNKCHALKSQLVLINPEVEQTIDIRCEGYTEGTPLSGYVFLCVDNIELRKKIVQANYLNPMVIAMFDFRMGLQDAQHYAARWSDSKDKEKLLSTMNFTAEEAKEAMPVSACGSALCVLPTIRTITSYGVSNWMNLVKGNTEHFKTTILTNAFTYETTTF